MMDGNGEGGEPSDQPMQQQQQIMIEGERQHQGDGEPEAQQPNVAIEGEMSGTSGDGGAPSSETATTSSATSASLAARKADASAAYAAILSSLDARIAEASAADAARLAELREERDRVMEDLALQAEDDEELINTVGNEAQQQQQQQQQHGVTEERARVAAAVAALRSDAASIPLPVIVDHEFESEAADEAIVLDSIFLSDIRREERRVEADRVAALKEESARFIQRLEAVKQREAEARENVEQLHADKMADIELRRKLMGKGSRKWKEGQRAAFIKAERLLTAAVDIHRRTIQREFGSLRPVPPINPDGRIREKPHPNAPRLIAIKIDCLRAIKNKVPGGFYVMLVTLYDRLGGHPLRWCRLPDSSGITHFSMTSQPQRHGGKFYNLELSFAQEQNLLTIACPSLSQSRPNNCLVFELVGVRGGRYLSDQVVAWSAFPLCSSSGDLIHGRYKLPMLRGGMDLNMDKYAQMQERMGRDIDYWLGNLYFEANPIPMKANYDWTGLRIRSLQYKINVQAIMKGNYFKMKAATTAATAAATNVEGGKKMDGGPNGMYASGSYRDRRSDGGVDTGVAFDSNSFHPNRYGGRISYAHGSGSLSKDTVGDSAVLRSDIFNGGMGMSMGQGAGGGSVSGNDLARKIASRERAKELRSYKYSITNPEADVPVRPAKEKANFLWAELTGDLSLSRMWTMEFWSMIGFFVVTFWLRFLIHYYGQYVWLTSSWNNNQAVYEYTIHPTTVTLRYFVQSTDAPTTEAMVFVVGVVSNQLAFIAMMIFTDLVMRWSGTFSDAAYRFILCFAVNVFFDPIFIALIDIMHAKWDDADFAKLYHAYDDPTRRIGYAGVFLTLTLTAILMCISFVLIFIYLTRLHMNGRMLDVYHRLHGDEGQFFIPNDMEISIRTLRHILAKAKKWSGFHGTKRKILLTAYLISDHLDRHYHDCTLHLSIYNVTPKQGKRAEQHEIFRHFIRTNDGAIMEAIQGAEDMGADGMHRVESRWLSSESALAGERQQEAEDMMRAMVAEQKRGGAAAEGGLKSMRRKKETNKQQEQDEQ